MTVCRAVFGPPSKLEGVATKLRYSQTILLGLDPFRKNKYPIFCCVFLGGHWRQCLFGGREQIARREVSVNEQVEYRFIEARVPEEGQAEASRHSSRHKKRRSEPQYTQQKLSATSTKIKLYAT